MQGHYVIIYFYPDQGAVSVLPAIVKPAPDSYDATHELARRNNVQPANSNDTNLLKKLFKSAARAATRVRNFAAAMGASCAVNYLTASQLWNAASATLAHSITGLSGGLVGLAGAGLAALAVRSAVAVVDFGAREAVANTIKNVLTGKLTGFKKAKEAVAVPQTADVIPFPNRHAVKQALLEKNAA